MIEVGKFYIVRGLTCKGDIILITKIERNSVYFKILKQSYNYSFTCFDIGSPFARSLIIMNGDIEVI